MSYKWQHNLESVIIMVASTYGSGTFSAGNYNGTGGGVIKIGPLTFPVTGATMALVGAVSIAAATTLGLWLWQRRRNRQAYSPSSPGK